MKINNNILIILHCISFSIMISGLIINNLYSKNMMKLYDVSRSHLILSDIFGHLIPFFLLSQIVPKTFNLNHCIPFTISIMYIIFGYDNIKHMYEGIPELLLKYIPPILFYGFFIIKYHVRISSM